MLFEEVERAACAKQAGLTVKAGSRRLSYRNLQADVLWPGFPTIVTCKPLTVCMTNSTCFASRSTPLVTPPLTGARRRIVVPIPARPPTAGSWRPHGKYKNQRRVFGPAIVGYVPGLDVKSFGGS